MPNKTLSYTLKFRRKGKLLDAEIHPYFEDAAQSAIDYASTYCTARSAMALECLVLSWDELLGPLEWSDGEYTIVIESYLAKHNARKDNDCKIIQLYSSSKVG